jgi:arsenate reductase
MKIWHNNRCSKSRCAIDFLNEKNQEYEIYKYLESPPTKEEIKDLLLMLGINASELVRKNEPDFKANFKGKKMSESNWIEALVKFPKLIERPIIINKGKAVIGRPTENILDLL